MSPVPGNSARRRQLSGARRVIEDGLSLRCGDVLTIFWDENTRVVEELIREAAQRASVTVRSAYVPLADQCAFDRSDGLNAGFGRLIDESRAVVTCLTAQPDCMEFRKALLLNATRNNKRVGHMPGITPRILQLVPAMKIDYGVIEKRCDDLAVALTFGDKALLRTYRKAPGRRKPEEFELRISLGGFERPAVLSPGRVPLGRWGNLPGGETFIAPIEYKAEGEFVLNGSFNSRVLKQAESLVLEFRGGELHEALGPKPALDEFYGMFAKARDDSERSWRVLAELGIGANQGIRRLTGISLFDEKCLGTVHIALGDNSAFGGRLYSSVHEDLVTLKPSLWIDEKAVLHEGELVLNNNDWRENIDTYPITADLQHGNALIRRGLVRGRLGKRRLQAEIGVGDGRLCAYTVGDASSTSVLARIFSKIGDTGAPLPVDELIRRLSRNGSSLAPERIRRGLSILKKHRILAVVP